MGNLDLLLKAIDNGLPVRSISIDPRYQNRHLAKLQDVEEVVIEQMSWFPRACNISYLNLELLPRLRKLSIRGVKGIAKCPDWVEELDISSDCSISDVSNCRSLRRLHARGNTRLNAIPQSLEFLDISWENYDSPGHSSRTPSEGPRIPPDVLRSLRLLKKLHADHNPTVTACPETLVELYIDGVGGLSNADIAACRQLEVLSVEKNKRITMCPSWVTELYLDGSGITDIRDCARITKITTYWDSYVLFFPHSLRSLSINVALTDTNIEECTNLKSVTCHELDDMRFPLSIEVLRVKTFSGDDIDIRRYVNLREIEIEGNVDVLLPTSVKRLVLTKARALNLEECMELEDFRTEQFDNIDDIPESVVRLAFSTTKKILDLRHCEMLRCLEVAGMVSVLYIPSTVKELLGAEQAVVHRV